MPVGTVQLIRPTTAAHESAPSARLRRQVKDLVLPQQTIQHRSNSDFAALLRNVCDGPQSGEGAAGERGDAGDMEDDLSLTWHAGKSQK